MPCAALLRVHPRVRAVDDLDTLVREEVDVFSPNALGGALDDETVEALRARVVCGGANNQLVSEGEGGTADRLLARGITYAPDFLVNAGGVIQVSDELHGFDMHRARERTATIFEHTLEVLRDADAAGVSPAVAADRLAERRIAAGGRRPWLPGDRVGSGGPPRGNTATRDTVVRDGVAGACSTHVPLASRHTHDSRDRSATWDDPEHGAVRRAMPPRQTHEGVTPWGAAEPRPSRRRSLAS